MALRLSELIVCGELLNTRKNCVHGYFGMRGCERPLGFELTGNCAADLAGRHIRFEVRNQPEEDEQEPLESEKAWLAKNKLSGLAWMQIGPTGTMTAEHRVRIADGPTGEWCARSNVDESSPATWVRGLYLEWFSQNGRMVVELVDPVIEFVAPGQLSDAEDEAEPIEPPLNEDSPEPEGESLGITSSYLSTEGEAADEDDELALLDELEDSPEEESDSYGLIPDDLQRQLDAQAQATDRELQEDDEDEENTEELRQMELMDELIDHGEGEPVGTLFDDPVKLRPPDGLDEREAEQELKALLARLALHGVALDMCEHYTAAEAYRLLVERVCREERAFSALRGTQWVQHFATSDYCPACQAEFERK